MSMNLFFWAMASRRLVSKYRLSGKHALYTSALKMKTVYFSECLMSTCESTRPHNVE
jgi:hypothetical protein